MQSVTQRAVFVLLMAKMIDTMDDLSAMSETVKPLKERIQTMLLDLSNVLAKVSAIETVGDSAVTLLKGLSAELRAVAGQQVDLNAIADRIDAQTAEMAAAITESTPAANEPVVVA